MNPSIPASALVDVIPGVLSAGGNPLSLNAVFLTSDTSIPIGTVQPFPSSAEVAAWFGASSPESVVADVYFAGYTNCTTLPETLYFAQFNSAAVAAYLRGSSVAALTLTQIQALSGIVTISINGVPQTSPSINLSSATSQSNAATIITAGLQSATGRFNGTAHQVDSADVMTVDTVVSGAIAVGDIIVSAGADSGLTVVAFLGGTGGVGTYTVSTTTGFGASGGTVAQPMTVAGVGTASYDAQRQAFVITAPGTGATSTIGFPTADSLTTGLNLTSATGAVLSQGAAAATPAGIMDTVVGVTQNWATFMTVAEQILSVKEAFAAWVQTTNQRYLFVCQDSDALVLLPDASASFGPIIDAAGDTGVMPVYDNSGSSVIAALQCAIAASIDFNRQNGRTTFAFRGQAGLTPQITSEVSYDNLIANGYNCYAAFATANQQFQQNQPGQISGPFLWADTYVNQIFLNSQFQLALMNLLATVPSVPYVTRGYNLIRSALLTPINQALNFGSIVAGVALSGSQSASLNAATGDSGATATIQNTGWYLQILDPGSIVRGQRGSPVINFWYTDGGSIQKISMSSIDVL